MIEKFTLLRHEMAELKNTYYEQAAMESKLNAVISKRLALKKEIEDRVGIKDLAKYQINEETAEATLVANVADKKIGGSNGH